LIASAARPAFSQPRTSTANRAELKYGEDLRDKRDGRDFKVEHLEGGEGKTLALPGKSSDVVQYQGVRVAFGDARIERRTLPSGDMGQGIAKAFAKAREAAIGKGSKSAENAPDGSMLVRMPPGFTVRTSSDATWFANDPARVAEIEKVFAAIGGRFETAATKG